MFTQKLVVFIIFTGLMSTHADAMSVDAAMDAIVTRLYEQHSPEDLSTLTGEGILEMLTPEEREALAARHVHFTVNVPVVVSVMRHTRQASLPFWLPDSGFTKTEMTVTNTEGWEYEVWQKEFPAGPVGLGINGFHNHRPHYFVSVGAVNPEDDVVIGELFPNEFELGWMNKGAFVYNDWTSLLLEEVPEALEEHTLLTTIRGRARATHLVGGFRSTPHPSSGKPDDVVLTWTEDPKTTQTVQWRGSVETSGGVVQYRRAGFDISYRTIPSARELVQDRFLANDRYCYRYNTTLRGLTAGTDYEYRVGFPEAAAWSEPSLFTTAPAEDEPFSFLVFGDTQSIEPWGPTLNAALKRYPDAAFASIAGDVVDTGQYRDQWDRFFHVGQPLTRRRPLMPALGNHDVIDGLGADMWRASHALPMNGPPHLDPERVYSFEYSNVLFVVLDSGLSTIGQAAWLEEQLANSDADWKIVVYHFPPYNYEHPYPMIESLWGYLYDKYEVNIAFEGHIHYYMRSKPILRGEPQAEGARGTTHVLTISTPNRERKLPPAEYAAVQFTGVPLYQAVEVTGDTLRCLTIDPDGKVWDEFTLTKERE